MGMLHLDKIIQAVVACIFLFVIIRFAREWLLNRKDDTPSEGHKYLDDLIRKQELYLKGPRVKDLYPATTGSLDIKTPKPVANSGAEIASFREHFQHQLKELQSKNLGNSAQAQSLEFILELLKDCEWGEGPFFKNLSQTLSNQWSAVVRMSEVMATFKELLRMNGLHQRKGSDQLITKDEMKALLPTAILYSKLMNVLTGQDKDFERTLRKEWNLSEEGLKATLIYFLEVESNPKKRTDVTLLEKVLDQMDGKDHITGPASHFLDVKLFFQDNKEIITDNILLEKVQKARETIRRFTLPDSTHKQKETAWAYEILSAGPQLSEAELKAHYTQLVKAYHPDSFSGMQLSAKLKERVHDNFTQIQAAYALVRK